jgi:hypothetical protein
VIAAAIPDAMLLPTDECFAQEVPEAVYDGLTCPKYALLDSNPGFWLAKEQKYVSGFFFHSYFNYHFKKNYFMIRVDFYNNY